MTDCVTILSTAGSPQEARAIAAALIEQRLAACVQIMPITSFYVWDGKTNEDAEYLLLIKARAASFAAIEASIKERHSYAVPEIIALPVLAGSAAYLDWLAENTQAHGV